MLSRIALRSFRNSLRSHFPIRTFSNSKKISDKALSLLVLGGTMGLASRSKIFDPIDEELLQSYDIFRSKITLPRPKFKPSSVTRYQGTREELLEKITPSIHQIIESVDFNGLVPYVKLFDQMALGKRGKVCHIDSQNENDGTTCVGLCHLIIKNLKEKHGVEGSLAVERIVSSHNFEHAAIIIQCSNGYILIDPRLNPKNRLFSIPYNFEMRYEQFTITSSEKGKSPSLTIKYNPPKERSLEIHTDVVNGEDIVIKRFMVLRISSFIPIAVYQKNGLVTKCIMVYPAFRKIILKDYEPSREEEFSFDDVQKNSQFYEALESFMGKDFHTSPATLHHQLVKFVSQEERMMQAFRDHLLT